MVESRAQLDTDNVEKHSTAMTDIDDELDSLVPRAMAGERHALTEIIRVIHPPVLRYTRARISGRKIPNAEDVAQEICLAVAQALPRYKDQGRPFMAFVYGIASNKVADAYRSIARDKTSPTEIIPESTDEGLTPEAYALVEDESNRVSRILDELSDKAREIIILRVFVGLSAEETAEVVGSTSGAVRVAQHRAIAQMRRMYESEGAAADEW